MLRGVVYIILGLFLLMGYIRYIESRSIFFPAKKIEFTPEDIGLSFEDVYITTEDNIKINGWFIPNKKAEYTIFLCHGNGGNIGHRLDKLSLLYQTGLNIFIIDYRGYGRSSGKPYERGLYLDAQAGYNYLVNKKRILPQRIILYGESLGSSVVIDLASKVKIGGLIIEGGFSRGRDMAKRIYPFLPSFLFSNMYDSLTKIKDIKESMLFIHSRDDEIVPLDLAYKLYNASKADKRFVLLEGSHNNAFLESREKYISSITAFIREL